MGDNKYHRLIVITLMTIIVKINMITVTKLRDMIAMLMTRIIEIIET